MGQMVNPLESLKVLEISRESIEKLRERGLNDVDMVYGRVMDVLESENEPKIKELEEMLGISQGGLIEFAEMLEDGQVSRATLDKYEISGKSIGYLRRESNRIYFDEKGSE
jgi:hypothetical protein